MRPINLIPPEERRTHGAATRSGPLAYILVGSLAVLLIGVVVLVLTSNQISNRENEVTTLESEKAAAAAQADGLTPYTNFKAFAEQRTQTISSLADSRFDWPRVINQLARILPPQVYFGNMSASAGGGTEGASGIVGPSLEIEGCAPRQAVVAAFVSSLKSIDGVTRTGLRSSTADGSEGALCPLTGAFNFVIVIAFDGAPPSPDSGSEVLEAAPPSEEPAEAGGEESSGTEEPTEPPAGENSPEPEGEASSAAASTATGASAG